MDSVKSVYNIEVDMLLNTSLSNVLTWTLLEIFSYKSEYDSSKRTSYVIEKSRGGSGKRENN